METRIKTGNEAHAAVERWRAQPEAAQKRILRQAIECLELDQMYYEQKGNDNGVSRCEEALAVLRTRLAALAGC